MIKYLKLENFKCFDELELEIAPLTLITGVNGMGKSSAIQSLLLLRQSFDERYLQVDNQVLLKGELVNLVNGDALRYALAKTGHVKITVGFDSKKEAEWDINAASSSNKLKCKTNADSSIYEESLFSESFAYLYAERLAPQEGYLKSKESRHNGRLGTRNGELAASLLYSVADKNTVLPIPALKHKNAEDNYIHKNISAWLSEIVYSGVQIRAEESTPNTIELNYSFTRGKFSGNQKYSPVNVAFGFSYVLPVVVGILTAEPGSLLLIENPEAHLHPGAQAKMGKLLALAAQHGVQIIVETHSDHLLNGIRLLVKGDTGWDKVDSDKIIVHYFNSELEDDFDKRYKDTLKINPSGKLDGWPVGFFDEWEKNLRTLVK